MSYALTVLTVKDAFNNRLASAWISTTEIVEGPPAIVDLLMGLSAETSPTADEK